MVRINIRRARKTALPNELRFVGLDEAGRGPVLGPLVIAICALTQRDLNWCKKHRVTDSKKIPAQKRENLAKALMERCWYKTAIISPQEIDQAVRNRSVTLNGLEINHLSYLIADFKKNHTDSPAQIMVDSPVKKTRNFRLLLSHLSGWEDLDTLKAENFADANHRHVGAASIIAKYLRDSHMAEQEIKIGIKLGSGYASDPVSREYVAKAPKNDPLIRWSWFTATRLSPDTEQPKPTLF